MVKRPNRVKKSEASRQQQPVRQSTKVASATPLRVWRPGVDDVDQEEELTYDPTTYYCLQNFQLDWPALSFDVITDNHGSPRYNFPHSMMLVSGTQALQPKQNYVIVAKIANITQGKHGIKDKKGKEQKKEDKKMDDINNEKQKPQKQDKMDKDDGSGSEADILQYDDNDSDSDEESDTENDTPPQFNFRKIQHNCGVNRIRCMPQNPAIIALQGDDGMVCMYDASQQLLQVNNEKSNTRLSQPTDRLKPIYTHSQGKEGFALAFSSYQSGLFATGNNSGKIFVHDISGGSQKGAQGPYKGHEGSVEDIQWSSTQASVFISSGSDGTIRVWDTRDQTKSQLSIKAHSTDVNVISWNTEVSYMIASGADDGSMRVFDLRDFKEDGYIANFSYHKSPITSIQWCPQQSEMIAASTFNQVSIWDLALERDPEEEQQFSLVSQYNQQAQLQQELPPQLLFEHGGQTQLKEISWHPQIPGMLVSTAQNGFNIFKPMHIMGEHHQDA